MKFATFIIVAFLSATVECGCFYENRRLSRDADYGTTEDAITTEVAQEETPVATHQNERRLCCEISGWYEYPMHYTSLGGYNAESDYCLYMNKERFCTVGEDPVYRTREACCAATYPNQISGLCLRTTPVPTPPPIPWPTPPPTPEPTAKPTTTKPTSTPTTRLPTLKPTPKPSPKPTPRPTKRCCLICWACKRDQKKIAKQDAANAAAHAGTPTPNPTGTCMSGDARVGIQSDTETLNGLITFKNVRDLIIGDKIRGLDKKMDPAACSIEAIGHFGTGPVYDNYTEDHFILDRSTNVILPHGATGEMSAADRYAVLTSCPVGLEESGVGFTPFSTVLFGSDAVSWSDYILIHRAIVDIVKVVGPFVFSPETYTSMDEVGEYTNALYKTLLTCIKDPKSCDAFELAALELVEMSMTDEARVKVKYAFPDFGKLNMPHSIAASVTNGASVIHSWVPDWMGLNKGCRSEPLGSIETYTPKYEEQSACCSSHYNWDYTNCMDTTLLPPSGWYPAWTSGINECLNDGNQPEYMSKNPTQYLFPDRQACCNKHYSWSLTSCLFESGSTDPYSSLWYMDWTIQVDGACVIDCPQENVACGGIAKSWDTLWSSKEECCKMMKWWDASCMTN